MTTMSTEQLHSYQLYLPFLSDLSLTRKVYSLGRGTGLTIHNFLSTSHQINTIRKLWQTLTTTTPKDLITLIPSTLVRYREWWLDLVREDPVHVLIETLLISFLIYLVLIHKKEKYRKKMQDRLKEDEIDELLKEWKERGRLTLTGVPIEEAELKKKEAAAGNFLANGSVSGTASGSETASGGISGGDGLTTTGKKKKINMSEIVIESMRGSKLTVRLDNTNIENQKTPKTTGKKDKKDKHNHTNPNPNTGTGTSTTTGTTNTMTVLNFATHDFLGMSCPEIKDVVPTTKENGKAASSTSNTKTNTNANANANANTSTGTEDNSTQTIDVVKEASVEALMKYGCGSCGPRGFYGTIDAHLDLEDSMTSFLKTDGAVLYSDGAAASASTVAAFAKRGDLLVVDEGIYEALGTGVILSRANVKYFKHNDMEDLRNVLERIQATDESLNRKKNDQRRFIVVEALYKNYGTLCPLDELVKLKEEFCYRLILDESFSFGSIGKTGRGALEHFNLEPMRHAEIVTFSLEYAMGSIGGITVGNEEVVDHQRLSGAGYCFSAASPPFLSAAAQASLKRMEMEPQLLSSLREKVEYCYDQMYSQMSTLIPSKVMITSEQGISPIVYLQLTKNEDKILSRDEQVDLFDEVAAYCLENGVFVISTGSHVFEHLHQIPPPGIRMTIMTKQSKAEIDVAIKVLKKAISTIL